MSEQDYVEPATVGAAVAALAAARGSTRLLAGGTDVLVQLRSGRVRPDLIVNLKRIPDLSGVRTEAGAFVIGAATPCAVLGEHAALARAWPGVIEAATLIGSKQVQGRASLGGNLCNGSPAADSVPALIAAGAVALIDGPGGRRECAIEAVPAGPGRTTLAPAEILVAIRLPARPARSGDAYLRLIPRTEMDIAVVGAAVNLTLDEAGVVTAARVALGAVAPTALLVEAAGAALVGSTLDAPAIDRMQAAVRAACRPIDDKRGTIAYRTKVAGVLAGRAARIAHQRATQGVQA